MFKQNCKWKKSTSTMKLCFFSKQNIRLVCEMHELDSIIQKQNDDWIAQWNDAIDSEKFNVTVANRAHQYGENVLELILIDFQTIVSVCIVFFFVVQIGKNTKKRKHEQTISGLMMIFTLLMRNL